MALNIFRLLGDLSHLASIFLLLHKIIKSRSCRGISFKTQLCYLIVFLTRYAVVPVFARETKVDSCPVPPPRRYIDLLTGPSVSLYNTFMKLFFIGSAGYVAYLMKYKFR